MAQLQLVAIALSSRSPHPAYRVFLRVVDIAVVMGSLLLEYYILIGDRDRDRGMLHAICANVSLPQLICIPPFIFLFSSFVHELNLEGWFGLERNDRFEKKRVSFPFMPPSSSPLPSSPGRGRTESDPFSDLERRPMLLPPS